MKIHTTALLMMAGLLALMNHPAKAQEKPDAPPPPSQPAAPEAPPRTRGDMTPVRPPDRVLEQPVAYLGVLTGPVSRELRAQFGLADGFGLQVVEVMPDSPAQQAGLKEHDVLVNFEDQKLVNMEQLQTLVRSRKKDDSVMLTIITGGQQKQLPVKVGERMARLENERPRGGFMPMVPPWSGGYPGSAGHMEDFRERLEGYQHKMREYQEQVQKWAREGRGGPMPPPPTLEGPPRGGHESRRGEHDARRHDSDRRERGPEGPHGDGRRSDGPRDMPRGDGPPREEHRSERVIQHESASITRSDDSGIYSLTRAGDHSVFSVKPKDGEPSVWPLGTEAERAAVPEAYRAKLREMEELRSSVHRDGGPAREAAPPAKRPEGA